MSSTWESPEDILGTLGDPDRTAGLMALTTILKDVQRREWASTLDLIGEFVQEERARRVEDVPLQPSTALLQEILADISERYEQRQATGKDAMGHSSGFPRLDNLLGGLDRGRMTIMLAAPGAGKTTLSNQLAHTLALQGAPVIYVTFENSRQDLVLKQIARLAQRSPQAIRRGQVAPSDLRGAWEAYSKAGTRIFYIEGGPTTTVDAIRTAVMQVQKQFPATYPVVILDFLQRLATTSDLVARGAGLDDMRGRVGIISQQLRGIAQDTGTHIWAISSTNRDAYSKGEKSNLGLASGRESGDIEFAADAVITLAARKDSSEGASMTTDPFEIKVVKNRHGETGMIYVTRDRTTLRIAETEAKVTTFGASSYTDAARTPWKSAD